MQGILLALIPMFAWGSIGIISNKIGGNPNQQTFGLTLGALVFSVFVFLVKRPFIDGRVLFFGFIGGIFWAIGQNNQFKAMKVMGVSVANPLSSGLQLVFGSMLGAFVFREWTRPLHFVLGPIAIISLVIGFYFISKQDSSKKQEDLPEIDPKTGIIYLVYSTLGYLSYTILFNNILKFDAITVILPMSLGMIFRALTFSGFQLDWSPQVLKNSLVGVIWGIGNIFMLLAASVAGLAIAFSFSQLGALVSIFGGIFILKERKTSKEMLWISVGVILFILGAFLLGLVKIS